MEQKRIYSILYGNFLHHLDHLAPLSVELDLPLLLTDPKIYSIAQNYYPKLDLHFTNDLYLITEHLPKTERLISCLTNILFKTAFPMIKDFSHIWLPHGHSDKGYTQDRYYKLMSYETDLLFYGKNMLNCMKKSNALINNHYSLVRNFRYAHFLKNKDFYLEKLEPLTLDFSKPILLYAPTWNDSEKNTSFTSFSKFINKLTKDFFVICKWHPNLVSQEKESIEALEKNHVNESICFLHDFPLIYPLLSVTDLYLGDVSSIGYDFLTFEKPMVFLNEKDKKLPLFSCGQVLKKEEYTQIDSVLKRALEIHQSKYLENQKKLYEYTFGKKESVEAFNTRFKKLREKIVCSHQKAQLG